MAILMDFLRWLPAIATMIVIFLFSSLPSSEVPSFGFLDVLIQNGGHFLGYVLLALAFGFALPPRFARLKRSIVIVALALMYALSDEYHQSFVPGRNASWWDIFVDGVGATTAALLLMRYSPNSNSNPISSSET